MIANLYAVWIGFLAGCISGAVPGLFFYQEADLYVENHSQIPSSIGLDFLFRFSFLLMCPGIA